jgi:hypothetical protein
MFTVGLVFYITYLNRVSDFLFGFISSIAVYGVFTDEVAHLYPLNQIDLINGKEWIYKVFHLRTHDVYGMLIVILMMLVFSVSIYTVIVIVLSLIQIYGFYHYRFYH